MAPRISDEEMQAYHAYRESAARLAERRAELLDKLNTPHSRELDAGEEEYRTNQLDKALADTVKSLAIVEKRMRLFPAEESRVESDPYDDPFYDDERAKKAPKPYGDVKYADPKNGKYPIDTEAHTKAAWSYIHMPKNAAEYPLNGVKLAEVVNRIKAAAQHFGIAVNDGGDNGNRSFTFNDPDMEAWAERALARHQARRLQNHERMGREIAADAGDVPSTIIRREIRERMHSATRSSRDDWQGMPDYRINRGW